VKILVYPHDLGLGGSQLNAIEIAAAVAELGHEVVIFGRPGALGSRIEQLGLEFIESPAPRRRPSPGVVNRLVDLVDHRGFEILHGYEWPPTLEAVLATRRRRSAVAVSTVMSMAVPPFIPRTTPLLVGTAEIADAERSLGRSEVELLEPPVDLAFNDPALDLGVGEFRSRFGLNEERLTLVSVTRFAHELKLEGTLAAIDSLPRVTKHVPVQLVLVGDGPARDEVESRASAVNAALGYEAVILTGQLNDPRPAYAAADVALGMGGSALRALAFQKPLVVQGEGGFWKLLTPETVDQFLWTGWYGVSDAPDGSADTLGDILIPLLADRARRTQLADFGRALVEDRFSIKRAGELQLATYRAALERRPSRNRLLAGDASAFFGYSSYYMNKRIRRARGIERSDDFNSKPVRSIDRPILSPTEER
jgi:glycosyltransferase involved in cell wall biosynthesis